MRFTDPEIDLAEALRDGGLPWEPAEGDWFCYEGEEIPRLIRSGVHETELKGRDAAFGKARIWLPQWQQARAWLAARGYRLRAAAEEVGGGQVSLAFARGDGSAAGELSGSGATDLEAIYRAILAALAAQEAATGRPA